MKLNFARISPDSFFSGSRVACFVSKINFCMLSVITDSSSLLGGLLTIPTDPWVAFTNTIEQFFSVLKSKLHKMNGMSHSKLKRNIGEAIKLIPMEYYRKIFIGSYRRKNYGNIEHKHRKLRHKNYL
jgi:hypothetical protein